MLQQVQTRGVEFALLRLDLVHAEGNKHFKLAANLDLAVCEGRRVVTFGGAWSNNIHALAKMGAAQGVGTIGVIRGERERVLTPTLQDAEALGMQLVFITRADYRQRESEQMKAWLHQQFPDALILPEGGSNALAVESCREIAGLVGDDCDVVCVPVGTGGTLAGIALGLKPHQRALGVCVLKGAAYLEGQVCRLFTGGGGGPVNWVLDHRFHWGGYARAPGALLQFILDFEAATGIELEPVYSGKLLYAVCTMLQNGEIPAGAKVVAVHTGGLQGRRGFPQLSA